MSETDRLKEVKDLIKKGIPFIVFDLETTGFNYNTDSILSCSAIRWEYKNGKLERTAVLDQFINPERPIPNIITKITGITNASVENCPTEAEAFKIIKKFFEGEVIIGGYNSRSFDQKFLSSMYIRQGHLFEPYLDVDGLLLAKELLNVPSHKLGYIAEYFKVDNDLTFHRSIDDVIATSRIFSKFFNMC